MLLEKDLEILAGGVVEGRRIFANTIKYVLMGTSSNFGNMFSAGGASLILSSLPVLPRDDAVGAPSPADAPAGSAGSTIERRAGASVTSRMPPALTVKGPPFLSLEVRAGR